MQVILAYDMQYAMMIVIAIHIQVMQVNKFSGSQAQLPGSASNMQILECMNVSCK